MRLLLSVLLVLVSVSVAEAGGRRSRRQVDNSQAAVINQTMMLSAPASIGESCADALDEVNAARAKRGLQPFQKDELLTQAALAAAKARATTLNAGHTSNDFSYLPSGGNATAAGCAAWTPDWGWGACCTYENYTNAGAAWVMGSDGRRYMHLYVR